MRFLGSSLFVALALAAGIGLPVQAGVNGQLRAVLGGPVRASLGSFAVGTLLLLAVAAVVREPWPALGPVLRAPWWVWTGGAIGAYFIFSTIVVVPRLGSAMTFALIVGGQMAAALAIDAFGLFGTPQTPPTLARIAGAALLALGVLLVRK